MTEENLREQDKRLRNQIQNLLESEEGRTLWAGSIEFRSIQVSMNSISIGYVDATGAKTLTCKEPPREEFRTAMQAMSFYYSDIAGNYGVRMPLQAFFNVEKVVPKRDKKSGALKGVRLGGRFYLKGSPTAQRFSTIEDITPTDNMLRIMRKIYDEAALYISGERREENLFKTSRDGEQESSDERANEE